MYYCEQSFGKKEGRDYISHMWYDQTGSDRFQSDDCTCAPRWLTEIMVIKEIQQQMKENKKKFVGKAAATTE